MNVRPCMQCYGPHECIIPHGMYVMAWMREGLHNAYTRMNVDECI